MTIKSIFSITDLGFFIILILAGLVTGSVTGMYSISNDMSLFLSYASMLFLTVFYIVMGEKYDTKINDDNYSFKQNGFLGFGILDILFVAPYRLSPFKKLATMRPSGKYREIFSSISIIICVAIFSEKPVDYWVDLFLNIASKEGIVVILILAFALLSYGLKDSKYFDYIAYRLIEKCGGSTSKLIIYMFIITSILTLFTSNDIVILVLTPIILKMLRIAKIKNARLILLSQFVAANTLSMALIFGSPTNLFFAIDRLPNDNSFIYYMLLMIVPTIIVFMTTLIVIDWINGKSFSQWDFDETYELPDFSDKIPFDKQVMTPWLTLAGLTIVSLVFTATPYDSIGNKWYLNPLLVSILIILVGYIIITKKTNKEKWVIPIKRDLFTNQGVPWQILFFAISFFMVAHEVALLTNNLSFLSEFILLFDNKSWHLFSSISTTIIGVNIVNDLPAAVMLAKLSLGVLDERIVNIGMLVGLNIGTYLTPIGALAGMMWFHELSKKEKGDFELKTPTRHGLFKYGFIMIFASISMLVLILPELFNIYDWLVFNNEVFFYNGVTPMAIAIIAIFAINAIFNNIISKHLIAMKELNIILGIQNVINKFIHSNKIKTYSIVLGLVLILLLLPVWVIESSLNPGLDINKFLISIPGMIGVGMDVDTAVIKLQSPYGKMIMGVLPIISIALVVWIMSAINHTSDVKEIRRSIASGNGGGHRVFIIGDLSTLSQNSMETIYDSVTHNSDVFFTFLVGKSEIHSVLDKLVYDRILNTYVDAYSPELDDMIFNYKLNTCEEIFIFGGDEERGNMLAEKIYNANKIKAFSGRKIRIFYANNNKDGNDNHLNCVSVYNTDEQQSMQLIESFYAKSHGDKINYKNYLESKVRAILDRPKDDSGQEQDLKSRIKNAHSDYEVELILKDIKEKKI